MLSQLPPSTKSSSCTYELNPRGVWVSVSVNYTHNADRRWKNFVVNGVGKTSQEYATKMSTNDGVTLRRFLDLHHRLINRVEEMPGSCRGSIKIPFERGNNFGFGDLTNSEPTNLLELLLEIVPDV